MLAYVQRNRFHGICIDLENIPDESLSGFYQFLEELSSEFKPETLEVFTTVPAEHRSLDYRKIAALSDYVIVMAYDEHWATGSPGPLASIGWVSAVLRERSNDIPPEKLMIGLASYAYDWGKTGNAKEITFQQAMDTAARTQSNIRMDPVSLNPMFEYVDTKRRRHQVWMKDAPSIFNELAIARKSRPYGVALWRLGSEDPSVWKILTKRFRASHATAQLMATVSYDTIDYQGQGEILEVAQTPVAGRREIVFDERIGLVVGEGYRVYPAPYVIARHGAASRKIALTFDDGPDPRYTPQILDILKKGQVAATFFIVGWQGLKYPELLKREIEDGHEIGNHTFTHANIAKISPEQLYLEVSATDRLLECVIGRRSYLFRPPFGEDSEPQTVEEIRPIEELFKLGYVSVGMKISPDDWRDVGPETIARETLRQVDDRDLNGNVVVLHDAGGDRSATIQALPKIIEGLRARGYEFVTISQLIGKRRNEVGPPGDSRNPWIWWGSTFGIGMASFAWNKFGMLILALIAFGLGRSAFVMASCLVGKMRAKGRAPGSGNGYSVAVVIPAFNEETVIAKTVASVLAVWHPERFEIVVVDDGSTDRTLQVLRDAYGEDPRVKILPIPNSGKCEALNHAVRHTDADIVVTLDADTVITENAIRHLVRHFSDRSVGAVAGNAKVGNRINLLTRWQALEYITVQNIDRRAYGLINSITVVPGAIGAWRRGLILAAGGFSSGTLAEDADMTIMIRRLGYRVCYDEYAVAWTEAPASVPQFLRQRYRWTYGTFQVAWKNVDALFRLRYGFLGCFALPNVFLQQVFLPIIAPLVDLLMLLTLLSTAIDRWQHPMEFSLDPLQRMLLYYALFFAMDLLVAAFAFMLEKNEDKKLLFWLLPQRFLYRQLMYYVGIKSILSSLRGEKVGWNKVERKGTIALEPVRTMEPVRAVESARAA